MRLTVSDLVCVRGGRQVFSGLCFAVTAGEALAGHRPERRRKILAAAGDRRAGVAGRWPAGTRGRRSRARNRRAGALPRPSGRAQALADGGGEPRFWTDFLGGGRSRRGPGACRRRTRPAGRRARRATCLPGQRRRLSIARLLAVKRPIWLLDEPTTALDAAAQVLLAGLMRAHLAGGGLILAATHGPIGLDGAAELRLGEVGQ